MSNFVFNTQNWIVTPKFINHVQSNNLTYFFNNIYELKIDIVKFCLYYTDDLYKLVLVLSNNKAY